MISNGPERMRNHFSSARDTTAASARTQNRRSTDTILTTYLFAAFSRPGQRCDHQRPRRRVRNAAVRVRLARIEIYAVTRFEHVRLILVPDLHRTFEHVQEFRALVKMRLDAFTLTHGKFRQISLNALVLR